MSSCGNHVVVVAHPDDEILFFSSVVESARKVIICFGPTKDKIITEGREALSKNFTLKNATFLNIRESDVFGSANWIRPVCSSDGILVGRNASNYQANFQLLEKALESELKCGRRVYTHNPWGEYGHEEHIQVFRVIENLSRKYNNEIFVSNYISERSYVLFKEVKGCLSETLETKEVPIGLCEIVKREYQEHNIWTWADHNIWPSHDVFFKVDSGKCLNIESLRTLPLNFLDKQFKTGILRRVVDMYLPRKIEILLKSLVYR